MCGIFGYLGARLSVPLVLEGLSKLEYRGYDSSGLATVLENGIMVKKTIGGVDKLVQHIKSDTFVSFNAIGHTRWATHGVPTEKNAHPHIDQNHTCAVVHNGIIENFKVLKANLLSVGVEFSSDTDSEIIVQLFAARYQETGDIVQSFSWTLAQLQGSFACALIHKDYPDLLLCASQESPLLIGAGEGEHFISSDSRAFLKYTKNVQALASGELAVLRLGKEIEAYNFSLKRIHKEIRHVIYHDDFSDKQGYSYYMLKEIHEQPDVLERLLKKYVSSSGKLKPSFLEGFILDDFDAISIVACGSSYHAGFLAKYLIESMVSIPVHVEIASEFRYRQPYIGTKTLAILISQSGETADTLAALKEFRSRNVSRVLGICNVEESALASRVDYCLFLEAGIEVGVASTKAFTAQLLLLKLLALKLASDRSTLNEDKLLAYGKGLLELPNLCQKILDNHDLNMLADSYFLEDKFIFLGRRLMYPVCLESALKLKEIAYVEANAYPGGEMKHGPLALISDGSLVVAFCGDLAVYEKMIGCVIEVKTRNAHVIAIAPETCSDISAVSDKQIFIPECHPMATPILYTIVGQIMAYTIALKRGETIDCPRNLAKSVTVE
ncbi:glutamine-fructose-6-phosphate transaminase [Chlamydia ibidis]|uniref:Glutamine--fructose-6-phosphate aminotransferase [isomerizing] n=2 Tax=Chlamydia ibidis TaxID=1405396 RepID=S7KF25_9CHLA|nr:glutamine--fructose-6-phosphate transaminase (isomerizing) [Chlamydia ibidis]EPP34756.1 glutamine-fructose-6-phosphate transaminase [Chlamydia ibidis]EQM62313.1 glutamine-fructose-6-phosphate transaminase [Chlamydia ibidis 10-1398/6]